MWEDKATRSERRRGGHGLYEQRAEASASHYRPDHVACFRKWANIQRLTSASLPLYLQTPTTSSRPPRTSRTRDFSTDKQHDNTITHPKAAGPGGPYLQPIVLDHATTIAAGVRKDSATCNRERTLRLMISRVWSAHTTRRA